MCAAEPITTCPDDCSCRGAEPARAGVMFIETDDVVLENDGHPELD